MTGLPSTWIEADEMPGRSSGPSTRTPPRVSRASIWTFTAIDADSKLMVSWLVGRRTPAIARALMEDVAARLAKRVQLTTDGHHMYLTAVEKAFGYNKVDSAMLIKTFGQAPDLDGRRHHSPPVRAGTLKKWIMGNPDQDLISPSYVERANLRMRMGMRRFTRLTNGCSKKAENHTYAVSLYFMHHNFCRTHGTLTKAAKGVHTAPAMAAGVYGSGLDSRRYPSP